MCSLVRLTVAPDATDTTQLFLHFVAANSEPSRFLLQMAAIVDVLQLMSK
jgi:hypothetical protein